MKRFWLQRPQPSESSSWPLTAWGGCSPPNMHVVGLHASALAPQPLLWQVEQKCLRCDANRHRLQRRRPSEAAPDPPPGQPRARLHCRFRKIRFGVQKCVKSPIGMRTRTRIPYGLLWDELFLDPKSHFPQSTIAAESCAQEQTRAGQGAASPARATVWPPGARACCRHRRRRPRRGSRSGTCTQCTRPRASHTSRYLG